jgi:hypothetical protein
VVDEQLHAWRDDVIAVCTDRFERRLVEETSAVRVQIARTEAVLRQDMGQMDARIRQDMSQLGANIRQDVADTRVELLKWSFLFWIGQVVTITAILNLMLRLYRS